MGIVLPEIKLDLTLWYTIVHTRSLPLLRHRREYGDLESFVVVDMNHRGWIDINVTGIVRAWMTAASSEDLRLSLHVSSVAHPGNIRLLIAKAAASTRVLLE